jgi:hypothetical protein
MNDLILCPACSRHIRRVEASCPFCGGRVPLSARTASQPMAPRGLSRARLYAFHAAVATGVVAGTTGACGGSMTTSSAGDASGDVASSGGNSASDGASSSGGGTAEDASSAADTAGNPLDGSVNGSDASANADAKDATRDGWGLPPPPYGCVFPGGCDDVIV